MFLITLDLRAPGQDYDTLYQAIATLPGAIRYQQSSWIACFAGSSIDLRNWLGAFIDANDQLLVARIADAAYFDRDLLAVMAANGYPVIAA